MSNLPTIKIPPAPFDPKALFEQILQRIHKLPKLSLKAEVGPHLQNFLADPTIQSILDNDNAHAASQEPPSQAVELKGIHTSLATLTKAIEDIQKKVAPPSPKNQLDPTATKCGKGNLNSTAKLYSAVAGSRPPNPSLVVDLAGLEIAAEDRPRPEIICELLNKKLGEWTPSQARLAAVRWTAKGNLVVTGAHTVTPASLQAAAPHIGSIISHVLQLTSEDPVLSPRANIKWSKISINGIYTGASESREPYTLEECHTALTANNPAYATLTVTQLPSWVRAPSSYNSGAVSSLSVAFEDQDRTKLKALLAEHYLYCFGTRGTVKKWKCR
jgi:hypothetical protein